jgi:hypothetical protein
MIGCTLRLKTKNMTTAMIKTVKNARYIAILLILLYLLTGWLKDKVIVALGGYTHKETVIEKEVKYIKGTFDTLEVFNAYVESKGIILNPKPIIEYKYKYKNPVTSGEEVVDSVLPFKVAIKDSLLNGTFHIINDFKGNLLYSKFNYKPLFPKYLVRVDTIRETIRETNTLSKQRSLLGIGVGYNNLQYPSILGSYTTKKKLQILLEYGKSLDQIKEIKNGETFKVTPIDLYSIKLIKHF